MYDKLLAKAFRLLSMRSHSTKEVKDKLSLKADDPSEVERVMEYLTKNNLLNDLEFAKSFVRNRIGRFKGPSLLKFELQRKGISTQDIKTAIEDGFSEGKTQLDLAKSFLQRKTSWAALSPQDFKKKSFAALKNRGFSFETILSAIDEIRQKE